MSNAAKVKGNMAPSSFDPFPTPMVRSNPLHPPAIRQCLYDLNLVLSTSASGHSPGCDAAALSFVPLASAMSAHDTLLTDGKTAGETF